MTKVSAKYYWHNYYSQFKKKIHFFTPREIWLEPKSCLCSIYHNFVINEYFDLKFAVYLAITLWCPACPKKTFWYSHCCCCCWCDRARSLLAFFIIIIPIIFIYQIIIKNYWNQGGRRVHSGLWENQHPTPSYWQSELYLDGPSFNF